MSNADHLEGLKANDYELAERGDKLEVTLMYPAVEGKKVTKVEVDLCCVRAADSITVSFCHNRNAWVISRTLSLGYRKLADDPRGLTMEEEREEVELALIPAWTSDEEAAGKRLISDGGPF